MLANWVQETTSTTGTGTITLAGAASGYVSFSDHFINDSIVTYIILDANGTSRERGLGTLTSGTTLERTLVVETLVSGVIDNTSPAALTLTSGTHTVFMDALPGAQPPVATWLYNSDYKDYPDNYYLDNAQSDVVTANRCTYGSICLHRPRLITNISINVITADATATISKAGLYTCLPDGKPGTLIESVTIDVTTSGVKTVSLSSPRYFHPGRYYSAFATDGTPTIHATKVGATGTVVTGADIVVPRVYCPYETLSAWTDLPATATPIMGENYAPILYWD